MEAGRHYFERDCFLLVEREVTARHQGLYLPSVKMHLDFEAVLG